MRTLPNGGEKILRCAEIAADTYHRISDTSMRELQEPSVSRQVGEMVTDARDLRRSAASFARLLGPWGNVRTGATERDLSQLGYKLHITICFSFCPQARHWATVSTLRGKLVCRIDSNFGREEDVVRFYEPFSSIVEGDRVDMDIVDLLAKIKRQ